MGLEHVARRGGRHRAQRTGQHQVARAQRIAPFGERAGQPHGRVEGTAETVGAGALGHGLAAPRHGHRHRPQIDGGERHGSCAEDVQAAGGVVGDGVDQGDVPAPHPAVDDLQRGQREVDRAQEIDDRARGVRQVAPEDERHLGLHLRLEQPPGGHLTAVRYGHVREERTEVGPVHTELALHGRGGQADLAADDPAAGVQPAPHVQLLHGVRGLQIRAGVEQVTHRSTGGPGAGGLRKQVGGLDHGRRGGVRTDTVGWGRHGIPPGKVQRRASGWEGAGWRRWRFDTDIDTPRREGTNFVP